MSIKKKTFQGILWSAIQNWGSQAGSFIIFFILARLLTPSTFGLVALANLFIIFFELILTFGFVQKLIQKDVINDREINTVFWTQICLGCFFTFLIFITANYLANSLKQHSLTPILQWLSFLFIIRALSETQRGLLVRSFHFQALAIRSLFAIIMAGIVGILMAVNNYGVWSLVGQQLTYEITGFLLLWKASEWRPKLQFSLTDLRSFLGFGIHILGYQLTQFFNQRTDTLLVGYFLGEISLGYYTIARKILEVMTQLLIGTLNQVALPLFARLQDDKKGFLDAYYRATQWTCLITFPMFFSVIILSPELIITVFGEKWTKVFPLIQIISLAGIIRGITFFQRSAFLALGKPNLQFKLGLINSILNLIFCLIAIPWGLRAIALAYVLSDYVAFPIGQWMLSKLISLSWKHYLSNFLAPISCTLVMILVMISSNNLLTINLEPYLRLIIISFIGGVTYILSLITLFPIIFKQIWSLIKLN